MRFVVSASLYAANVFVITWGMPWVVAVISITIFAVIQATVIYPWICKDD